MVTPQQEGAEVAWQKEMVDKAEPKVLAVYSVFLGVIYDSCMFFMLRTIIALCVRLTSPVAWV